MRLIRTVLKYVSLVALGVAIALALAEGGLRLIGPGLWKKNISFDDYPWMVYDPVLGWTDKAGFSGHGFRVNSLHFRGEETLAEKRPGTLRIVCLGDSRTFGIWLNLGGFRFDNNYPAALAERLHGSPTGVDVEVINAGVIGYTSGNGLRQLRTQILKLHPDIVTVAFGLNDHHPSWKPALRCVEPHDVVRRELFYELAPLRTFQLGLSLYQGINLLHPRPFSVRWVEPEEYAYNLRRLAQVSRRAATHLLFVTQALRPIELGDSLPAFPDSGPVPANPYGLYGAKTLADVHRMDQQYTDILQRVAQEENVPVADAAAAFAAHRSEPLWGRYDFLHCDPRGAQLIAATIQAKLVDLHWLSAPDQHG
jgi:lysophospholipase L1-like esterase